VTNATVFVNNLKGRREHPHLSWLEEDFSLSLPSIVSRLPGDGGPRDDEFAR